MAVIGIDTLSIDIKNSQRQNAKESSFAFRTILGVGVVVNDYEKFRLAYSEAILKAFKTISYTEKEKEVYCNYDFRKIYELSNAPVHNLFFREISKHIDGLYVFNTTFSKSTKMFAYSEISEELGHKLSEDAFDFDKAINKITAYFPLIGVWCDRDYLRDEVSQIYIDGITPIRFNGWRNIQHLPLEILFEGDKCNAVIATADIIAYLISMRLRQKRLKYGEDGFREALPELNDRLRYVAVTRGFFKYINPVSNKNLNINSYLNHPIIFLFKDEAKQVTTEVIRALPGFDSVYNFAFRKNGSVKFFDKQNDQGKIREGDYIVYFSEDGKRELSTIKGVMGENINLLSFDQVRKEGVYKHAKPQG